MIVVDHQERIIVEGGRQFVDERLQRVARIAGRAAEGRGHPGLIEGGNGPKGGGEVAQQQGGAIAGAGAKPGRWPAARGGEGREGGGLPAPGGRNNDGEWEIQGCGEGRLDTRAAQEPGLLSRRGEPGEQQLARRPAELACNCRCYHRPDLQPCSAPPGYAAARELNIGRGPMANDEGQRLQERLQQQAQETADAMLRSVRAWNELLAASTDMAFDVVLKNWDYSRSLRSSAEQAIADAIRLQQRLSKEMLQAWEGYSSEIKDVLDKGGK
ncbi:MAG: hypothetical protein OHK0015_38240 [Chloroflexi bacterium OHK40]